MSIKIHHGPPGSYKTSGAVMDDFIPAAKAGRVVITNVRGLDNEETIREALGDIPETFRIVWIDTKLTEGRDKLARFFQWADPGAFILIDEAQMIFPLAWKEKELALLDYPGGVEQAALDNRPPNFLLAFEMHRHYGWDMVLTTPNIAKIRGDIRGCCEGAYKHKNQALIGLKGRYLEAFHLAEDNGKAASDFLSVRGRKIRPEVWKLYASTATGTHSDTIAGTPLWKNPRVLGFLVFLFLLIAFLLSRSRPAFMGGNPHTANSDSPASMGHNQAGPSTRPTVPGSVHNVSSQQSSTSALLDHPLSMYQWRFNGMATFGKSIKTYYELTNDKESITYDSKTLNLLGYSIQVVDSCHAKITYQKRLIQIANCLKPQDNKSALVAVNNPF